jgi:hypothetical protein
MEYLPSEITDGYLIAAILQSDAAVRAVRRELNQVFPNLLITSEAIRNVLRERIMRQEVLDSQHLQAAYATLKQVNALSAEKRRTRSTGTLPQVPSNEDDEKDALWHDKTQAGGGG